MSKLNPLHIERIINGESPDKIDPQKGTGRTTAFALQLLNAAMENPNRPVTLGGPNFAEREARVIVAIGLAEAAGLRHIYRDKSDRASIIFEYRKPEER